MATNTSTALSLRRSSNFKSKGKVIDYQANGLMVRRIDLLVIIEVIHECQLQDYVEVGRFETVAKAQFAEKLAKLICAGITASIPVSDIMAMVSRINGGLEELGVPDRQPHRECRSFKEDLTPVYEFSFYDSELHGVVSGQVGVYAELHEHLPGTYPDGCIDGRTTDRSGKASD